MRLQILRPRFSEVLNGVACLGLALALIAADRARTFAAFAERADIRADLFGEVAAQTSAANVTDSLRTFPTGPITSPASSTLAQTRADDERVQPQPAAKIEPASDRDAPPSNTDRASLAPEQIVLGESSSSPQSSMLAQSPIAAVSVPGRTAPVAKRTSAVVPPIVRQRPKPVQVTTKSASPSKKAVPRKAAASRAVKKRQQTASAKQ